MWHFIVFTPSAGISALDDLTGDPEARRLVQCATGLLADIKEAFPDQMSQLRNHHAPRGRGVNPAECRSWPHLLLSPWAQRLHAVTSAVGAQQQQAGGGGAGIGCSLEVTAALNTSISRRVQHRMMQQLQQEQQAVGMLE